MTTPKPRWFRFSLRAMLVAMTLCGVLLGWLGWTARVVSARRAMIESIESRGGKLLFVSDCSDWNTPPPEVTWLRQLLGDRGVAQIVPPQSGTPEEDEQFREAFPEAYVFYRVTY